MNAQRLVVERVCDMDLWTRFDDFVRESGIAGGGSYEHDGEWKTILAFAVLSVLGAHWVFWTVISWLSMNWKLRRMWRTVPRIRGGWPFLGQGMELSKGAPWDVMTRWAMEYGWIYQFTLLGHCNVVVSDPAYMKEIMRNKLKLFNKDIDMAYKPFLSLLGTGIVTSDGPKWRKQRNKVSAAFRIEVLSEVPGMAQRAVQRLCKKLDAATATGESVEIGEEMRHLTLQVISEALLSLSPEEADGTFATVYMPIVVEGHKRTWNPLRRFFPFLPAFWAHRRNQKILNDYITGIIRRRWDLIQREMDEAPSLKKLETVAGTNGNGFPEEAQGAVEVNGVRFGEGSKKARRRDILDKVLAALEPGEWGSAAILQIRDEIKTFVLAGHETSASMLNWSLYELITNESLMKKVLEESEAVFGRGVSLNKPPPSIEELRRLEFTEACLREALRKYSVVPLVVRRCMQDTILRGPRGEGHFIPKDASVHLMIKGVHERSDIWPEPKRYDPSRFLKELEPYTFLPFIDGPRNCLGQHLSLLESKVVMSLLVNRYEFSLVNENASEPNPWIIPTIPQYGTHLNVKLRQDGS